MTNSQLETALETALENFYALAADYDESRLNYYGVMYKPSVAKRIARAENSDAFPSDANVLSERWMFALIDASRAEARMGHARERMMSAGKIVDQLNAGHGDY